MQFFTNLQLFKVIQYYLPFYGYRIAGKFGEFGKSSAIRQTKTIQSGSYNYNHLLIRQIFPR